jgi:hypothetical protein
MCAQGVQFYQADTDQLQALKVAVQPVMDQCREVNDLRAW